MINWFDIDPKDAVGIDLSVRLDITAPLNEEGERCPWPWQPQLDAGLPIGMYHCRYCGTMVVAGVPHPDYKDIEAEYEEYMRQEEAKMEHQEDKSLQERLTDELGLFESATAFRIFVQYLKDIKSEIEALDPSAEGGTADDQRIAATVINGIISSLEPSELQRTGDND